MPFWQKVSVSLYPVIPVKLSTQALKNNFFLYITKISRGSRSLKLTVMIQLASFAASRSLVTLNCLLFTNRRKIMHFTPLKWQNTFCEFLCTVLLQGLAFICVSLSLDFIVFCINLISQLLISSFIWIFSDHFSFCI